MSTVLGLAALDRLSTWAMPFADGSPHWFDQVSLGAAVLLTLVGTVLFLHGPRHRMSLEEHAKDGDLSEEEARRQLRFYQWCAPLVTTLGVVLLIVAIYDLTK